jgi:hypothetical protein
MQGLCCFWGGHIFGSVSASVEIAPFFPVLATLPLTNPESIALPHKFTLQSLCQIMSWR